MPCIVPLLPYRIKASRCGEELPQESSSLHSELPSSLSQSPYTRLTQKINFTANWTILMSPLVRVISPKFDLVLKSEFGLAK
jgi:hypothetical protein